MLQVSNISKAYGEQVLFEQVTFSVGIGEHIGLVGRNGHGKTTLFRLITGEEHADGGTITVPAGYTVGHLSQRLQFAEETVFAEACKALPIRDDGADEAYKAEIVLQGLGFNDADLRRSPFDLSGGFQVRLNLAKLLVTGPNLILLDEPTNYLDILSLRWLAQFLRAWKNEFMLITHDRDFMDNVTTHTLGIHRCKMKKIAGPTQKLYDQILQEEEVYEKTRVNDEKRRREIEEFINRFRAQATRARAVQSKIKALKRRDRLQEVKGIRDLEFTFNAAPFQGRVLLEAKDLAFSFDSGSQPLIDGLSISVGKDDRVGVIGRNGKGKTTLLNLLAGELEPLRGRVMLHPNAQTGYFGQTNVERLGLQNTVEEEILAVDPDSGRRVVRAICGSMMFEGDLALKKISVLSGGERSRVLLGKILVRPANLLLLDEPTNHLDMSSVDSLLEALDAFSGAVVIVTHSEMILNALVTRLIVFDRGEVRLFEGTYQDFLDRVGWSDEAPTAMDQLKRPLRDNGAERRELRRQRAEIIDSRSRALGALQKSIAEVEGRIMDLEKDIDRDTDRVLEASENGQWQDLALLSKAIHDAKDDIERLFTELETLTTTHDKRSSEFEVMLRELENNQ